MDGSAVHRAAAVFTAAACIRRGGCAAVGAGNCRFGCGCLLNLLTHIFAYLRQCLTDLLAELFAVAVLDVGFGVASCRHSVRSAGYGAGDYDAAAYIEHSNETELVIPLAEDFEFIENIDEILSVEGLEIVNFGPVDFALSKNKVFCGMDMPEIVDALTTIIEKCRAKNISVMVPGIPPTYESVKSIIDMGANMLAVGTDIMHFNNGLRTVKENVVSKFQS